MASSISNAADLNTQIDPVDEPSMDDILASIKQIIADDEAPDDGLSERERYTHPTDHSNTNVALQRAEESRSELDQAIEADLTAAMEDEVKASILSALAANRTPDATPSTPRADSRILPDHGASPAPSFAGLVNGRAAPQKAEPARVEAKHEHPPHIVAPAIPSVQRRVDAAAAAARQAQQSTSVGVNSTAQVPAAAPQPATPLASAAPANAATMRASEPVASRPQAATTAAAQPAPTPTPATPRPATLEERVARVRSEVSEAAAGLSSEERLEKYRVRGKLNMETLAAERAKLAQMPPPPPTPVAPMVTAGPVLPTSEAVAKEMAATMMKEKSSEIENMLLGLMRPTIRQWLSNNLPTMVEKLVREEIERVSRSKRAS